MVADEDDLDVNCEYCIYSCSVETRLHDEVVDEKWSGHEVKIALPKKCRMRRRVPIL